MTRSARQRALFAALVAACAAGIVISWLALESPEPRTDALHVAPGESASSSPPIVAAASTSARAAADSIAPQRTAAANEVLVTGRAVDREGRAVAGARVLAFDLPRDGSATERGSAEAATGRFELALLAGGELRIAVSSPRHAPALRTVEAKLGERVDLGDVVLDEGASITGRVTLDGEPLANVEVVASTTPRADSIGGLRTLPDRCAKARESAQTDAQGRYALAGLAPGRHSVRIGAFRSSALALDAFEIEPNDVEAPAHDVDFTIAAAKLAIGVTSGGVPVPRAEIEVEVGGSHFTRTCDANGELVLRVLPAFAHTVTASAKGLEARQVVVHGVAVGAEKRVEIALVPRAPSGSIEVRAQGGEAGTHGEFTLRRREHTRALDERVLSRYVPRADGPRGTHVYVLDDVPPGTWDVEVFTGQRLNQSLATSDPFLWTNCTAVSDVEVVSERRATVDVDVEHKGKLRIECVDERGNAVPATITLSTLGSEVPVPYGTLPARRVTAAPAAKGTVAASWAELPTLVTAFCGGDLRVRAAAEGYEPVVRDHTLVPTSTVTLRFVLRAR